MSKISHHHGGLGYIVLYGTASTEHVTYRQALECMERHGLAGDFLNPPSLKSAFSRSINEMEKLMPAKFAREVRETGEKKVMAIIREEHETNTEQFDFEVETIAELDKTRKSVLAHGPDKGLVEKRFLHYSQNVIGDDLRQMARKVVESLGGLSLRGSVNVRDAGGIYFVPRKHAKQLEALSNVLEELEIGYLKAFGVMRGTVEQESIFATSAGYIKKEMMAVSEAVTKLTTRVSSAQQYKKRLERLKDLLLEYAALSEMLKAAGPLLTRLDAAIALVEEKNVELTAERASRRRAPSSP